MGGWQVGGAHQRRLLWLGLGKLIQIKWQLPYIDFSLYSEFHEGKKLWMLHLIMNAT